jgi:tRNA(Ile)-lysidine synthase
MKTENSKTPSDKPRKSSSLIRKSSDFHVSSVFGKRFVKRILNNSNRAEIIRKNDRILLAFSGGPDSTALFHVLLSLRKNFGIRFSCAHVNYRLRKNDSDLDEVLVRKYCEAHSVPLHVFHPKDMTGKNEESLRTVRYRFFEKISQENKLDVIATAHTRDDQAETVLLRLLRGSGPSGLGAIRTKRDGIIRPFLGTSKNDILRFLEEERLGFRKDKSNDDTRILRNRIRHRLIPLLESDYQPNVREMLARTAETFSKESDKEDRHTLRFTIEGSVTFSRKSFLSLTESGRSEELRRLYRAISHIGKNPGAAFVREAERLIASPKGKIRRFESLQLKIEARGDTVVMMRT